MKECFKCKEVKPFSEYWKVNNKTEKLQHYCKNCQNAVKRKSYKIASRNTRYIKNYGITLSQYNERLNIQNHKCSICETNTNECGKNFAVDHDHSTGKVRGLLCDKCNRGLGAFKDSKDLISKAYKYLMETT
jgi:predicted ATP-dependent endonuclease of OLD family